MGWGGGGLTEGSIRGGGLTEGSIRGGGGDSTYLSPALCYTHYLLITRVFSLTTTVSTRTVQHYDSVGDLWRLWALLNCWRDRV